MVEPYCPEPASVAGVDVVVAGVGTTAIIPNDTIIADANQSLHHQLQQATARVHQLHSQNVDWHRQVSNLCNEMGGMRDRLRFAEDARMSAEVGRSEAEADRDAAEAAVTTLLQCCKSFWSVSAGVVTMSDGTTFPEIIKKNDNVQQDKFCV
jgi:hypothetical protein